MRWMNNGKFPFLINTVISRFRSHATLLGVILCVGRFCALAYSDEHAPHAAKILSKPVTVDRVYKSMEGITGEKGFGLTAEPNQPELLWVTGGRIDMVRAEDGSNGTEKFLCHAYLKFDDRYFKTLGPQTREKTINHLGRLFTFVQGQADIRLPRGFGIPVLSTEPFEMEYMVINPTQPPQPFQVNTLGVFDYVRDTELKEPLKPLVMRIVGMHVPVKQGSAGPHAQCSELGDASMAGGGTVEQDAEPAKVSLHKIRKNKSGFDEVYHWMVPPGRHEYRYQLESQVLVNAPFDTTVHYINAHLHPHGEFLELRDVTTDNTVFRSVATNNAERTGLTQLTHFSSEKGIPIYRNHQYEMVAGYNNTTDHDIDAMAIFFVYLLDQTLNKEQLGTASAF